MAINAIHSNMQLPKTQQYQKVKQKQPQQVPEKPKETPTVKQQEQIKGPGHINTFA